MFNIWKLGRPYNRLVPKYLVMVLESWVPWNRPAWVVLEPPVHPNAPQSHLSHKQKSWCYPCRVVVTFCVPSRHPFRLWTSCNRMATNVGCHYFPQDPLLANRPSTQTTQRICEDALPSRLQSLVVPKCQRDHDSQKASIVAFPIPHLQEECVQFGAREQCLSLRQWIQHVSIVAVHGPTHALHGVTWETPWWSPPAACCTSTVPSHHPGGPDRPWRSNQTCRVGWGAKRENMIWKEFRYWWCISLWCRLVQSHSRLVANQAVHRARCCTANETNPATNVSFPRAGTVELCKATATLVDRSVNIPPAFLARDARRHGTPDILARQGTRQPQQKSNRSWYWHACGLMRRNAFWQTKMRWSLDGGRESHCSDRCNVSGIQHNILFRYSNTTVNTCTTDVRLLYYTMIGVCIAVLWRDRSLHEHRQKISLGFPCVWIPVTVNEPLCLKFKEKLSIVERQPSRLLPCLMWRQHTRCVWIRVTK